MQEVISCPSCQRKLQVPETLLGQDVQCPTCGATFVASAGGQTAPSPPRHQEEPPQRDAPPRPRYRDEHDDDYEERPRRRRDLIPHRGTMILVFGILSLVICPIIFGPMAWVMGNGDLAQIRGGRMDPEGEGTTQAG